MTSELTERRLYAQQLVKEIEEETVTKENFVTNPHYGESSLVYKEDKENGVEDSVQGMES